MFSDASLYSRHHAMQEYDAKLFLSSIVSRMDWSQESLDTVMDVGCGSGNSTRHLLLPAFPNVRKIVAVDVLPPMIGYAKENNAHPKIEYYEANIENRSSMQCWKDQMTKIVSIYCFHWLKHQRESFQNIYDVLQPGGEAALLFSVRSPFWNPYQEHIGNPKWKKYLKVENLCYFPSYIWGVYSFGAKGVFKLGSSANCLLFVFISCLFCFSFLDVDQHIPESNFMKDCSTHYGEMLEDIGFNVIVFEEEERTFTFSDDNECRNSITALCNLMNHVPDDLKKEFQEDFFQCFLRYNPRNSDGRPNFYSTSLSLLLKKSEKR